MAELLATFDADVARGSQVLAAVQEEDLDRPWRLKVKGRLIVDRPKGEAFRGFTLSHLIHHRGQLSVYLRLLDIPCPAPTARRPTSRFRAREGGRRRRRLLLDLATSTQSGEVPMVTVDIHEAKAQLSKLVDQAAMGDAQLASYPGPVQTA